ncbi:MAG: hypothetical protein M0Z28_26065, partial [Rhodospirillales bacterium]|nr:hypothetical protein [Rhodospirillales bacterium]
MPGNGDSPAARHSGEMGVARRGVLLGAARALAGGGLACAGLAAIACPGAAWAEGAAVPAAPSLWPHTLHDRQATVTVYQPQAESWPDRQRLTARMAVAVAGPGHAQPVLGTVEVSLATRVDEAAGIVHLSDVKLLDTHRS